MKNFLTPAELITQSAVRVAGFCEQADEKINKASVFVDELAFFKTEIRKITSLDDVVNNAKLLKILAKSCMLSEKAQSHLTRRELLAILKNKIDFNRIDVSSYVEELSARFLLTCGDSLGGAMRNHVGQQAQTQLYQLIYERLASTGKNPQIETNRSGKIISIVTNERAYVFDKVPNFLNKSVDIIVLKPEFGKFDLHAPDTILACGELKGGIDPAGADEHWKTAKAALERVELFYKNSNKQIPKLIFIGAAIEIVMANEICTMLENGKLFAAANLTNKVQLDAIVYKLISL